MSTLDDDDWQNRAYRERDHYSFSELEPDLFDPDEGYYPDGEPDIFDEDFEKETIDGQPD